MTIVRAFPARLVHPDWAPRAVAAMSESVDQTGAGLPRLAPESKVYEESAAALYVYQQRRAGASHRGLVCEVGMEAFANQQIRAHEAVHPDRVAALVRRHDRPGLVTLIHRAGPALVAAVDATCRGAPILDFTGPDGLEQTVWRVSAGVAARVTEELATAVFYIADGHHRVAAALEEWRLAGKPANDGLLCVVHPLDGLDLSAFHRRVTGPVDPAHLLGLLARGFGMRPVAEPPDPAAGSYGLYVSGQWYDVRRCTGQGDGGERLDAAVLQAAVLEPLTRLAPGPPLTVEAAPATTPVDELVKRCDDDGGALFTLAPPPLDVLTGLADVGEVMPAKATFFEPKPCSGIFLKGVRSRT